MHTQAAGVDLVCGPDSPLPEARQRYRLLYHLGAGGQAEVYRGVRLSAGVSSSPLAVKVFRPDPRRAVLEQLRSWDKGDAVLMDLNSRGVAGICLRVDGFYGLPPTAAGTSQISQQRIPYQVLDYLPGGTLIDRLAGGASATGPARLYGTAVLRTLADTLRILHHPADVGDSPVLHMDVKPSNVIVLPDGEIRLIDFTTARYDHAAHITTIPHTPESAGPEAYTGHVGPAYDVHGFGSVAYYLITGWLPRSDRSSNSPVAGATVPGGLRRHPLLDDHPELAKHLLAPLADRPQDRPRTDELPAWIARLARLAAALPAQTRFVDWSDDPAEPPTQPVTRPVTQPVARLVTSTTAPVVPRQAGAATPTKAAPTEVARPEAPASPVGRLKESARARWAAWWAEPVAGTAATAPIAGVAASSGSVSGASAPPTPRPPRIKASAKVPVRPPVQKRSRFDDRTTGEPAPPRPASGPPAPDPRHDPGVYSPRWRWGWRLTKFGSIVASVCWAVWVITVLVNGSDLATPLVAVGVAAGGAAVAYWLTRLAGNLVRSTLSGGPRKGTLVPHLVTTLYLVLCGLQFLSYTPLDPNNVYNFLRGF